MLPAVKPSRYVINCPTIYLYQAPLSWSSYSFFVFFVSSTNTRTTRFAFPLFLNLSESNYSGSFGLCDDSGVLPGVPISGVVGDQQAALFGQAAFQVCSHMRMKSLCLVLFSCSSFPSFLSFRLEMRRTRMERDASC